MHKYVSQYLVEPTLTAITAASLLGYVSTSFAHLEMEMFVHSSWQKIWSSVRLDGHHLWTAIFQCCHRFSIEFRSGLWLGSFKTLTCFDLNHSTVALAVCLGSLSCWKMNLRPSLKSFADCIRFSSRIALYLAPSLFPSILTSFPVPAVEKHSHGRILPPPCFTVGMVCSGGWTVLGFCHT